MLYTRPRCPPVGNGAIRYSLGWTRLGLLTDLQFGYYLVTIMKEITGEKLSELARSSRKQLELAAKLGRIKYIILPQKVGQLEGDEDGKSS